MKQQEIIDKSLNQGYAYGFKTDVETEEIPFGLNEDIIKLISQKKNEPSWLLKYRLEAFRHWKKLKEPHWGKVKYSPIDYQAIKYYSAPTKKKVNSLSEVDPAILDTYNKLGIPLQEQKILAGVVAVDAVFDSVSIATTYAEELKKHGILFCSFNEAVHTYPELVQKYLGSVVPHTDNFFACLNAAVFSDGSFVFIPKGVKSPIELSSYFRINAKNTGQFERTLIIAEEDSYVSYLEGCTAPQRDENQLHAAVVEIVVHKNAEVKYSTVQNWYPGDENGKGGIYNFVTKRGICHENAKLSWTQVETGSAITWKYPSCILKGNNSRGEFYSVALTNHYQQADTGTKMIHIGENTSSVIISKGISAGHSDSTYRGLVKILPSAHNANSISKCDSLLIGNQCGAHTFPVIENANITSSVSHEATTSKISPEQLFYCQQRGLSAEQSTALIVNGFCKEVMKHLPLEFSIEAAKLIGVNLEGSIG